MPTFPKYSRQVSRHMAAVKLQAAFRGRRTRKALAKKRVTHRRFVSKVNRAVLSKDPQQYYLTPVMPIGTQVTQAPQAWDISGLYYNQTSAALPNAKYYRTSNKIKVNNMQLNFRVKADRDSYNKVTLILVRHKRSGPVLNADLQQTQLVPPATIPQMQAEDVPFLPINANDPPFNPSNINLGFGSTTLTADPESLANFTNPKVVDVIWKKSVMVQPRVTTSDPLTLAYPTGFTFEKHFTKNIRLNEIWKYPNPPQDTSGNGVFPYNNKCYSIIAVSDSISSSASHPIVDCSMRLSFKDLD